MKIVKSLFGEEATEHPADAGEIWADVTLRSLDRD